MPAVSLERHHVRQPAFGIDLPAGAVVESSPDAALVALEPEPPAPVTFRSTLTVVVEELAEPMELDAYAEGSIRSEREILPAWWSIDRETTEIGGLPAVRTLGTYLASAVPGLVLEHDLSIALEQWRVLEGARAWIVSASAEASDYHMIADVWRACAESLRPGERR